MAEEIAENNDILLREIIGVMSNIMSVDNNLLRNLGADEQGGYQYLFFDYRDIIQQSVYKEFYNQDSGLALYQAQNLFYIYSESEPVLMDQDMLKSFLDLLSSYYYFLFEDYNKNVNSQSQDQNLEQNLEQNYPNLDNDNNDSFGLLEKAAELRNAAGYLENTVEDIKSNLGKDRIYHPNLKRYYPHSNSRSEG